MYYFKNIFIKETILGTKAKISGCVKTVIIKISQTDRIFLFFWKEDVNIQKSQNFAKWEFYFLIFLCLPRNKK